MINQFATLIETQKSRAPLDQILGLNSSNMESILVYDPSFFDNQEDTVHNLELVSSVGIEFRGTLHAQWFNMFMMDLLRDRAADLSNSSGTGSPMFVNRRVTATPSLCRLATRRCSVGRLGRRRIGCCRT